MKKIMKASKKVKKTGVMKLPPTGTPKPPKTRSKAKAKKPGKGMKKKFNAKKFDKVRLSAFGMENKIAHQEDMGKR